MKDFPLSDIISFSILFLQKNCFKHLARNCADKSFSSSRCIILVNKLVSMVGVGHFLQDLSEVECLIWLNLNQYWIEFFNMQFFTHFQRHSFVDCTNFSDNPLYHGALARLNLQQITFVVMKYFKQDALKDLRLPNIISFSILCLLMNCFKYS